VNKSEIRKKIFLIRKKKFSQKLVINSNKFINFLEKKDIKNKIIGGYYPFNFELNILNILEALEKKNTQSHFQKLVKIIE
tara:strand:+ start:248 stop:487 length:240 start_codon:yes stop_codon:yes gene_type:complete